MEITKDYVVQLLKTRDDAVIRALVALNNRQTEDEQSSESTKHANGRGFTYAHGRVGTNMAKFFLSRGFLTHKQIAYWRTKMPNGHMRIEIYANQLVEIAKQKQEKIKSA